MIRILQVLVEGILKMHDLILEKGKRGHGREVALQMDYSMLETMTHSLSTHTNMEDEGWKMEEMSKAKTFQRAIEYK